MVKYCNPTCHGAVKLVMVQSISSLQLFRVDADYDDDNDNEDYDDDDDEDDDDDNDDD